MIDNLIELHYGYVDMGYAFLFDSILFLLYNLFTAFNDFTDLNENY